MLRFAHRSFVPVLKRLPLRVILSAPFVLQMIIMAGLVSYLSHVNGQRAVDDLAEQLIGEVGNRVQQQLQTYIEASEQVVQLLVDDMELGISQSQDWRSRLPYLLKRSQTFNRVSSIYIGGQQGQLIAAEPVRSDQPAYLLGAADETGSYRSYVVDASGHALNQAQINQAQIKQTELPHFDPRQQRWYKAAATTKQRIWRTIDSSIDSANPRLTLTAAQPFYIQQQVAGVAAANLDLTHLDRFLAGLQIARSGEVFILEPNGLLVASSSNQPTYHSVNGTLERVAVTSSQNLLMQATLAQMMQHGGLNQMLTPQKLVFSLQGQRQFVQITPWQADQGLNWIVVVVVPESDFMAQIHANTRMTLLLCSLATLIAMLIGVVTAHWMTAPLMRLNLAAKNIARGKWQTPILIDRADEVGELANSFNQMAAQLQQSFDALQEGQNQLAKFLEAVPIGICVVESNGKVSYMNQTAQTLLGRSFESEIPLKRLVSLCNAQLANTDSPYPLEQLPTIRAFREKVTVENVEICRGDQVIPLEVRATPILDTAGQISHTIVAFQDVSDRKQAATLLADYNRTLEAQIAERTTELTKTNLELKQAKQAAEAANLAKSAFLANMSHELRTPLNAILGFAQIMSLDANASQEQQQHLRIINRSGEHLLSLINNVLDLSKLESGQIKLTKTCFNLAELLEAIDCTLRQRVEDKGLQLQIVVPSTIEGHIVSDVNKLRQILVNLLSNAIKFTEQGKVVLRVRSEPVDDRLFFDQEENQDQFESSLQPQWLVFEIEDTGIGIPSEELDRIFHAFEQSSKGRMTPEGTGLGLTISHKFIELMQGEIAVSSTFGVGSQFTVRLPVYGTHAPVLDSFHQPKATIAAAQQRLLIVDDQPDNRELLIRMLNPLRLQIKEVANGQAAISCWQEWRPHLILLDMYMPKMNGIQVVQQIRQLEQAAIESENLTETVIVALSASVIETDRDAALEAGCNGFIGKPFQANELFATIAQYMQLPHCRSSQAEAVNPVVPATIQPLSSTSLDFMPEEWCDQLYQAAIRCRDEQVMQLLQQIPSAHQNLADQLHNYAEKFQFEMILQLLQGYSKNDECAR